MRDQPVPTPWLDVDALRADFPLLSQQVNGCPLAYLDNAATTQKPRLVMDAMVNFYAHDNANVHRGVHALSIRATAQFEAVREKVRAFIHASSVVECVFVRGTTEAINLVAQSYAAPRLVVGDEILITCMEHHANIVPWQMVCERTGAKLRVVPITPLGEVKLDAYASMLSSKTKIVALSYASNALGTINPVHDMIKMAHHVGAVVLLDGAQATAHLPIDVQALDCDFYAFSGHKMYGPTGIGILWGREELLNAMTPYQGGGEMIHVVRFENTEYAPLPYKFEAGTPNVGGVIGLGAALDYLMALDMTLVHAYENELLTYATNAVRALDGFRVVGEAQAKVPVLSLVSDRVHSHDIATIVDTFGVAVRSGHHCAMPLMEFLGLTATTRLSLSFYNTRGDIDQCVKALHYVNEVFS
jgi:cysteine desulfurase/selenocysteine lyase